MRLQRYEFDVVYKKGTSLYLADILSRENLSVPTVCNVINFEVFRVDVQNSYPDCHPNFCAETLNKIKRETRNDAVLPKLSNIIISGWPNSKRELDACLYPHWNYRDELSIHDDIIYKGGLVIIPQNMIKDMLSKIHTSHFGTISCIRLSKDIITWPGMKGHIKDMCDSCAECAKYNSTAPKEQMKSSPNPMLAWQIVSQDLFDYKQHP